MTVKELRELLEYKQLRDDAEVLLYSNPGAPNVTEPDVYICKTDDPSEFYIKIMPGKKKE